MNISVKVLTGLLTMLLTGAVWSLTPAEQRIVDRIKPIGQVCIEGEECEGVVATAAQPVSSGPRSPEDIYSSKCFACHDTGAAGAPVVGKADQWTPRIDKGMETLISNAINGIGGMPAKGTCADCSDEEIGQTVELMVSKSQ